MRIPTEIGDSSRYTLPLLAFRLRTRHFSEMCPRHQEICCKNPFPEMLSFLGFGTRRLSNVGCFIDISGAKTIQKHRSSRQPPKNKPLIRQGTKKYRHLYHIFWNSLKIPRPGNTRHPKTPSSNSIWITSEYSPLDHILSSFQDQFTTYASPT